MGTPRTFKEVWAEKEAAGYQYGHDALENVQFGFRLAVEEYAALEADARRKDEAFRLDGYHPVTTHVIAECPHCHAHATLPITRDEWIKGTPVHLAALAAKSTEQKNAG